MPLYDKLELNSALEYKLVDVLRFSGKLDMFCVGCNKESTFIGFDNLTDYVPGVRYSSGSTRLMERVFTLPKYFAHKKVFTVKLKCSRNENHLMLFNFYIKENILIKIGQYPSLMDIAHHSLKKYKRLLGIDHYQEFNRAIGLAALNVGLGSFIYLKRIFDHLLEDAHKAIFANEKWNELEYLASPMQKRIGLLKNHLPAFLVEKRELFSILNKDVHELSEAECLKYFPLLQGAIEAILDDKLTEISRDQKRLQFEESVNQLTDKKKPRKKAEKKEEE